MKRVPAELAPSVSIDAVSQVIVRLPPDTSPFSYRSRHSSSWVWLFWHCSGCALILAALFCSFLAFVPSVVTAELPG